MKDFFKKIGSLTSVSTYSPRSINDRMVCFLNDFKMTRLMLNVRDNGNLSHNSEFLLIHNPSVYIIY